MKELNKTCGSSSINKVLTDSTNTIRKLENENFKGTGKCNKRILDENLKPTKRQKRESSNFLLKAKIFVDAGVQTEDTCLSKSGHSNDQNASNLLTCEKAPSEYWERLAENRQRLLQKVMQERDKLKEENDYLKADNRHLEDMVNEAKQLAELVKEVTGDSDEVSDY